MATIEIKAKTALADRVARRFFAAAAELDRETLEAQQDFGRSAEIIFAAHAPHRSGRLARGVASHTAGARVIVDAHARNPESGFDYVAVTRFGHKVDRIYPKKRRAPAAVLATKRVRASARSKQNPALRFVIGGQVLFRSSVAAYHPDHDWADEALPEVEAEAEAVATRLGRTIESRF